MCHIDSIKALSVKTQNKSTNSCKLLLNYCQIDLLEKQGSYRSYKIKFPDNSLNLPESIAKFPWLL